MNKVKAFIKPAIDILEKNAPSILTGISVAAGAGAVGDAIYETVKTVKEIETIEGENALKKKIVVGIKNYWTTLGLFTISAGAAIAANKINLARTAAIAAAYAISDGKLKDYKEAVLKTVGEKKEEEIRNEVARDKVSKIDTSNLVVISDSQKVRCMDSISGRIFAAKIEDIKAAVNEFNRRLTTEGVLTLNDFYEVLREYTGGDVDAISMGDDLGWDMNHGNQEMLNMSYSSQLLSSGEPCLVLEYNVQPQWWAFNNN